MATWLVCQQNHNCKALLELLVTIYKCQAPSGNLVHVPPSKLNASTIAGSLISAYCTQMLERGNNFWFWLTKTAVCCTYKLRYINYIISMFMFYHFYSCHASVNSSRTKTIVETVTFMTTTAFNCHWNSFTSTWFICLHVPQRGLIDANWIWSCILCFKLFINLCTLCMELTLQK